MLTFQGSGDVLRLTDQGSAGDTGTVSVNGGYDALQAYVTSQSTNLDFASFGGTDLLHLSKAEGFATPDQAYAALMPDGSGGFVLDVHGGTIHFDAGSHLSAGNFAII